MAAKKVWEDATILYSGVDISPESNSFAFPISSEALDSTNFASDGWMEVEPGRDSGSITIGGMVNQSQDEPRTILSNTASPVMGAIFTRPAAAGDVALYGSGTKTQITYPLVVNQIAEFQISVALDGVMSVGVCLDNQSNVTSTADGTGYQAGAIASGTTATAMLQCTNLAGTTPTLDVVIESDAGDTWAGAETARFTFTQISGDGSTGAEILTLAGPVTDTWWRATWTVGGTVTDADFFVLLAVNG